MVQVEEEFGPIATSNQVGVSWCFWKLIWWRRLCGTKERPVWHTGHHLGSRWVVCKPLGSIVIKGLRPLPPTPGREGEFTHTSLPEPTRKLYGYESKYKVWIKAPKLHTIHTPRSILWSIPCDIAWSIPLIHTLDPYPWSIPLSRWRKTDAGLNDAFYPNIYCFWFSYCYSHRYYRCFYCCLHCLRCCCRRHY